jgi:adenylate kinase family enzyme
MPASFRFRRTNISGPAGSGKSTLAAALAERIGAPHLDADDFEWAATDPPFMHRNAPDERRAQFDAATRGLDRWVLSGTLQRWGHELTPQLDLVVFLYVPRTARLARLETRERQRYGANIDPGGRQHASHVEFMTLAAGYESGAAPVNNLANAETWLAGVTCPVLRVEGAVSLEDSLARVLNLGGR